jgi:hypothetical protein
MTRPPARRLFQAPDAALLSDQTTLGAYLSRPDFRNFLPVTSGFLLVYGRAGRLVTVEGDERFDGPLSVQPQADRASLEGRQLSNDEARRLDSLVERLWLTREPERPGWGLLILVDRRLRRRLVFDARGPRLVHELLAVLGV